MRLASALLLVLAIGLCTSFAIADPINDKGESWDHYWSGARATYAEVEPNGDCVTAQPVALGDIVDPAATDPAGDLDFYKIYLLTTDRLTVITDKATGCLTAIDTQVYVYRDDCVTQLAYDDDDGPGSYSYIAGSEFTPPYDGYYFVKVKNYYATTIGCYKIWFYSGTSGTGACCSSLGVCTLVAPGSCLSPSIFWGPGTVCTPNPCPQPVTGACCAPTGVCTITTQSGCVAPNVWQGPNTVCVPNPCPGAQPPPVNDTCAGALAIERCTSGTFSGSLFWANDNYTTAGSTGCTGYFAPGKDVVYVVTLQAGDILHLVYTTPNHDGSLYVITDCANSATTCVVGEDDPEPETINWTATADGVYYIVADSYTSGGGAEFTLDYAVTCPPPVAACCFPDGSCQMLTEAECVTAVGVWMPGVVCSPNPCPQPPAETACCFPDGTCQMMTEAACVAGGGTVYAGSACEPQNPCPQPPPEGACCFADGSCQLLLEAACAQLGGVWNAGVTCTPNPCPPPPATGACCFIDGTCQVLTQAACVDAQGQYQGNDIPCTPTLCPPPVPTERTTWGKVKNTYR